MKNNKIILFLLLVSMIISSLTSCATPEVDGTADNNSNNNASDNSKETSITLETLPIGGKPVEEDEEEEETEEEPEPETEEEVKEPEISEEEGITYINGILIANKTYSLPKSYAPGVDSTANSALKEMFAAAAEDGISLWVISGYRSYDHQYNTYYGYVARSGQAEADRYSARPGHSEHQTGLAFDLNSLEQSFGQTAEGKWLKANCHKYGFIIRYPEDKEPITGYMYEPWHVRYLGVDIATSVYESGLCLEEYLNITSEYSE